MKVNVSFTNPTFYKELSLMIVVWGMITMKMWVVITLICSRNLVNFSSYFMTDDV